MQLIKLFYQLVIALANTFLQILQLLLLPLKLL
jgi:hypothetical protein